MPKGAINCAGDYVAPGLIELHTDNLERHIQPRPKVTWARTAAIVAHDAELASTGITKVFDALRVGSIEQSMGHAQSRYARKLATDILALRDFGQLKISHHLHLRSEICSQTLKQELAEFDVRDRIGIVSLMDHTPGQRQFTDLSKYENLTRGKYGCRPGNLKRMWRCVVTCRQNWEPVTKSPQWRLQSGLARLCSAMTTPRYNRWRRSGCTGSYWKSFQPLWWRRRPVERPVSR